MRKTALLALSLSILAPLAHGSDAYSSFSAAPGFEGYSSPGEYLLGTNGLYDFTSEGFQFTATASGDLTGFTTAINNGAYTYSLALYEDGGDALGAQLGSWSATASATPVDDSAYAKSVVAASGVGIVSGAKYWLVATNTTPTNVLYWNGGYSPDSSTSGIRYFVRSGEAVYSSPGLGAFSVQVNPVPEPATLAAMTFGVAALLRRRRR